MNGKKKKKKKKPKVATIVDVDKTIPGNIPGLLQVRIQVRFQNFPGFIQKCPVNVQCCFQSVSRLYNPDFSWKQTGSTPGHNSGEIPGASRFIPGLVAIGRNRPITEISTNYVKILALDNKTILGFQSME